MRPESEADPDDTRLVGPPTGPQPVVRGEPASTEHQLVGRYELVQRIGHGGMATVYLGRASGSAGFEKRVAIKVLHPHLSDDPDVVDMFLHEARIAAEIHHPHVVETIDLGEADGVYYLVMEFIEGGTLSSLVKALRPDKMPIAVALQILIDACAGLAAAHDLTDADGRSQDLVHRDVSPQNMMISLDGWVKVGDFGIAKVTSRDTNTRPGELRGKLRYMSPEQARGERLDRRTDVFALGVILWELCTGQHLFAGDTDAAILERVVRCEVPTPESVGVDLDARTSAEVAAGIRKILDRALARRPDDRYADVHEMLSDLRHLRRFTDEDIEPRRWLADTMRAEFGKRADYMRALLRGGEGVRGKRKRPRSSAINLEHAARRVTRDVAAASAEDGTLDETRLEPTPTQTVPPPGEALASDSVLSGITPTTGSQTVLTQTGRAAGGLLTWLLLPAIGAAVAVIIMTRWMGPGSSELASETEPPAAAAAEVRWYITSDPAKAEVLIGGELHAEPTPTTVVLPRSEAPVEVVLRKPGYADKTTKVAPLSDQSFVYQLDREEAPRTAAVGPADTTGDTDGKMVEATPAAVVPPHQALGATPGKKGTSSLKKGGAKAGTEGGKAGATSKGAKKKGDDFKPMPDFGDSKGGG